MGHWIVDVRGKRITGREIPEGYLTAKLRRIYVLHYQINKYEIDATTGMYMLTDGVEKSEHFKVELKPKELKRLYDSIRADYFFRDRWPDEYNQYLKGLEDLMRRKKNGARVIFEN